jgi:hypothetical protein
MSRARRNQGVVRLFVGEGLQARFEGEEFRCLSKVSTIVPGSTRKGIRTGSGFGGGGGIYTFVPLRRRLSVYSFFCLVTALLKEIKWSCDMGAPVEGMGSGSLRSSRVDGESSLRALAMSGVVVRKTIFLRILNR